jgi:penicillin amidase
MIRCVALIALLAVPLSASAQNGQDITLTAPDGQSVSIDRDDYGVPHISAPTMTALFYGQGYAVAEDRLFQMETFWRAATGRLAEIQGPAALTQDQQIRTVYYTPAERATQFAALSAPVREMMEAYVAGINAYITAAAGNPALLPAEYALGGFAPEPWNQDKLVAVLQFFMRRFGEIGGDELVRMNELQAQGNAWFEANRPVNDPTAPTTIAFGTPPPPTAWTPRTMEDYPAGIGAFVAEAAAHVTTQRREMTALLDRLGVPARFGSFAATISAELSESGFPMLLGAPQMGQPTATTKAVTSEVELIGPNGFQVAGMTVPGIPGVIIGRTADRAWTLTTGFSDNTDTYLEYLDPTATQYIYNGQLVPFEVIPQTFFVRGSAEPVSYLHFRSVHGPVYFQNPQMGFAATWKYAFWNRELEMVEAFYDVWNAASLDEMETALAGATMSFNVFYADREQNTAFWHIGVYPQRPGSSDPRLPLVGTGDEEWAGLLPFAVHPREVNPLKGYFVNWNNKPAPWWNHGDTIPWASTGERPRLYDGVTFLENHVRSVGSVSFDELQELTRVVRANGTYNEYPGTYQQVIEFGSTCGGRAENVVPPGQSGFVSVATGAPVPSPHFADQWALYESSAGTGDVLMKRFPFDGLCVSTEDGAREIVVDLDAPAPNPVAGAASLRYTIDTPATVRLSVFDALGREVAVLVDAEQAAGAHRVSLGTAALAPGVYTVRLVADGRAATAQRVVVVR